MQVAILHHVVSADDGLDQRDVLDQVRCVAEALEALGHEAVSLACTLDLAALRDRLLEHRPDVVFNLVESLGGSDWLIYGGPWASRRARFAVHRLGDGSHLSHDAEAAGQTTAAGGGPAHARLDLAYSSCSA